MKDFDISQVFSQIGYFLILTQIVAFAGSFFMFLSILSNNYFSFFELEIFLIITLSEFLFIISFFISSVLWAFEQDPILQFLINFFKPLLPAIMTIILLLELILFFLCLINFYRIKKNRKDSKFHSFFRYWVFALGFGIGINFIVNRFLKLVVEINEFLIFVAILGILLSSIIQFHFLLYKSWQKLGKYFAGEVEIPNRIKRVGMTATYNLRNANLFIIIIIPLYTIYALFGTSLDWLGLGILLFLILGTIIGTGFTVKGYSLLALSFIRLKEPID